MISCSFWFSCTLNLYFFIFLRLLMMLKEFLFFSSILFLIFFLYSSMYMLYRTLRFTFISFFSKMVWYDILVVWNGIGMLMGFHGMHSILHVNETIFGWIHFTIYIDLSTNEKLEWNFYKNIFNWNETTFIPVDTSEELFLSLRKM